MTGGADIALALRPFRPADLHAVVDLHARSFARLAHGHTSEQIDAHLALIRAPDYGADVARSHLMLAWDGDALVGTAGWLEMPDEPGTARIRKVFVDPDHARRGLATLLVGRVETEAEKTGRTAFFVRANLNAVPLYERLGYRRVEAGIMTTPNGTGLPVLYMRKP